eukprot:TRINITY_DN2302_c0_g3_i1.p1 TRINITY_DN2302_c0_g3~~TRINITY_DN2302_c0_g3_i1.p1  ORF type:complete len:276 (-),score=171.84 TRINITY_DN2302_c0_g3_i1:237-1010(-)
MDSWDDIDENEWDPSDEFAAFTSVTPSKTTDEPVVLSVVKDETYSKKPVEETPKKESDGKKAIKPKATKKKAILASVAASAASASTVIVDPLKLKKEQEKAKQLADFKNTCDTFGVTTDLIHDDGAHLDNETLFGTRDMNDSDAVDIGAMDMITFKPKTKIEFEKFAKHINDDVQRAMAGTSKVQYTDFVKVLIKKLVETQLNAEELRNVSGTLTALINDKLSAGKPVKKAPSKGVKLVVEKKDSGDYDDDDYDEGF